MACRGGLDENACGIALGSKWEAQLCRFVGRTHVPLKPTTLTLSVFAKELLKPEIRAKTQLSPLAMFKPLTTNWPVEGCVALTHPPGTSSGCAVAQEPVRGMGTTCTRRQAQGTHGNMGTICERSGEGGG